MAHTSAYIVSRKRPPTPALPHAAGLAATVLALGLPAHAQTTPATSHELTLKEVHVKSAREGGYKPQALSSPKFTQPLVDTPQTITVIPQEVMAEQNATTLQEALSNTPGVTLLLGEGGNSNAKDSIFMRGFDTSGSIFADGVRSLGSSVRDTFNVEQIEVIKGASGSEYGRGAPSGSVNMATKTPFADTLTQGRVSGGSADRKRATIDLNRQINDTTAFRLNAMGQNSGAPGRDFVRNKGIGVAPSIAFGLGTPTRITADLQLLRYDNRPDGGVPTVGLPGYLNALLANAGIDVGHIPGVDPSNFYGSLSDYSRTDLDQATVRIEHDLAAGTTLRNTTRVSRNKIDQLITGTSGVVSDGRGADAVARIDPATWTASRSRQLRWQENTLVTNQTNLTARFDTGGLKHALSTGLELIYEKQVSKGRTGAGTAPPASLYHPDPGDPIRGQDITPSGQQSKGDTKTVALYAFDNIEFTPQWQLIGGLRMDRYRTSNDSITAPNATTGVQTRTQLRTSGTLWSGKLGLVFKPAANGSIYASVSTSQQPPGGSNFSLSAREGNIDSPNMDPSKAVNLELGSKWELLDKRLLLTGALFQTTVRNDLSTVDKATGEVTQFGKKQVKGIELGVAGQLTPAWNISAGLANMSTQVVRGENTQTGAQLYWSPRMSFTSWTTYRFGNGLSLGGGARYQDSVARRIDNTASAATTSMLRTRDFWVFDASAAYQVNPNLHLQLNIYNLANKKYLANLNNNGGRYTPGAARSVLLSANMKF